MRVADASTPTVVLIASPEPLLHGALGVVRSLGRLGIPVYLAHDGRPMPTDRSRYLAGSFTVVHDQAEPARWVEELARVGRSLGRRAVLVPIDDLGALAVNDHADRLAEWFLLPRPDPGLARTLASKRELHLLCRRLGVPSPETVFPQDRRDVLGFLERARPPVVVKAIDPLLLYQRPGARSVMVAHSRRELLDIYDRMEVPERPNLMLQEYIPGGPESIWMFNGYLDRRSRCLVGFTGTKQRQCLPHTGPTSLGVCRANPVVEQATTEFLAAVGYQGVVDLGWRYDARDGRYKLLDVNPRIGGTFRLFVAGNGMDVVRALYLDLTGQPVPAAGARDGRKWLVEPNDLRASLLYWREGALTPGQWLGSLRGVEEAAWFARDDLAPFLAMCRSTAAMAAAKAARSRRAMVAAPAAGGGDPAAATRQRLVTAYFQTRTRYWEDTYDDEDVVSLIHQHRRALALDWVARLGLPDGARVLDVGAGAGLTSVALAGRGYQVTAVDASAAMTETIRRRAAEAAVVSRLQLSLGDAHLLPFGCRVFSLVMALGLIPWLHSPERAAREMARVLAPGGYLVVSADNRARLTDLLDPRRSPVTGPLRRTAKSAMAATGRWRPAGNGALATFHRRGELDHILAGAGLEPVAGATFGFGPFTLFGRRLLSDPVGVRVDASLQKLADRDVPGLRSAGAQYLVVARKPMAAGAG
jgi:predicted ATP-grasp superfamily ATP-dependent carboligase/SAM-dependent methyltransferase